MTAIFRAWSAVAVWLASLMYGNGPGYDGRHRAEGALSTMEAVAEVRDLARYDHAAGAGRYAHLRIDELDAAADRDQRRLVLLGVT